MKQVILQVLLLAISLPICHLLRLSNPLRMSMQNEQERLDNLNLSKNWKYGKLLYYSLIYSLAYLLIHSLTYSLTYAGLQTHKVLFEGVNTIRRIRFNEKYLAFGDIVGRVCVLSLDDNKIQYKFGEHKGELSSLGNYLFTYSITYLLTHDLDICDDLVVSGGVDGKVAIYKLKNGSSANNGLNQGTHSLTHSLT